MKIFSEIQKYCKLIALKVTHDKFIVTLFYLILIAAIIVPFKKVINSPTTFEEFELLEDNKIPSFTFCPHPTTYSSYDSIETFEEAMNEVENAKKKYSATMHWTKSYTKAYVHFNRTTSEYVPYLQKSTLPEPVSCF